MKRLIIFTFIIFIIAVKSFTANTKFFALSKAEAFNKGDRKNITITEEGYLRLSGAIKEIHNKNDLIINDVVKGYDGNIYVATGNQGKVYQNNATGKSKVFFKSSGFNVISIAAAKNGIYAAVLPESEIWFINYQGEAKKIAKFDEKYIWKIEAYSSGDIFVACGDNAALYRVTQTGNKTLIFKNPHDNHFQALALYKDKVYFGSEGIGALYEYDINKNKTKVIYETYEKEITSIAVNSVGEVFFVTGVAKKLKLPRNNFDYTDSFIRQNKGTKKFSKNSRYLKNSVYVYNKEKKINKIFTKDNFIFHSIAVINKRRVYIGSGTMGIIFKIAEDGRAYYSYKLEENQILSLKAIDNNTILTGTGNPGKVYNISSKYAKKGIYTSMVYNAKASSNWGRIKIKGDLPASTKVSLETRTGDTSRPDNTWSKWLKTGANNKILSPSSRYIQFKAIIETDNQKITPVIRKILIPFLRHNRPPKITTLKFKKGVSKKKTGSKDYDICNLSWSAFDPDHDSLWYKILMKKRGNKKWKVVLKKTSKVNVTFDSRMFPDGVYFFKIIANDSMANPVSLSRTGEKISPPITIDNKPPNVRNIQITKLKDHFLLKFTASDELSMIGRVQVAINYGNWKSILPKDGIFDSKNESFKYKITKSNHKEIERGENVIIIKIMDVSGNLLSVDVKFKN